MELEVTVEPTRPVLVRQEGDTMIIRGGAVFRVETRQVRLAGEYRGTVTATLRLRDQP